jgi:hypothetical protein
MESFIEEYINSTNVEDVNEEVLLERQISPYATLRPGDLASLLKLHTSLPFPGTGLSKLSRPNVSSSEKLVEEIIEKEAQGLSSDESGDEGEKDEELTDVVCRGDEQNHVPAIYTVRGLRRHEMPVIGEFRFLFICFYYKLINKLS